MKYWPLSTLASSPLMHPVYMGELYDVQNRRSHGLSNHCIAACGSVANHTEALDLPSLALVPAVDTPDYRVYVHAPEPREFDLLERAGVVLADDMLYMIIAPLH